jgi:nicotinamide-nucleotide amidase
MRIEMLCTGNELLDGSVVDTNAAFFCERAFALGATVSRKETLPDDVPVLAEALRSICARADFVVVSGGLGPTIDDVTLDAAAQAAGVALEIDPAIVARLKQRFAERGFTFTPNNERQARVPRGGAALANPYGTAPLLTLTIGRAEVFLLPGVPREFRGLCEDQVLPRLAARLAGDTARTHLASRVLKLIGVGESMVDFKVKELPGRHPDVYVGFRTHAPENHLKLLARGATDEQARARRAACEADARNLVGEFVFGTDGDELNAVVFRALKAAGATVAFAESCTGGMLASTLASVPGASEVMVLSAVVYQERAKTILLGVDAELVKREGAVSAKVTRALAEAARERAQSTFGVAVTGWAGPGGGTATDPVGTVYLCLADAAGVVEKRHVWPFERDRVRQFATWQALDLVRRRLLGSGP